MGRRVLGVFGRDRRTGKLWGVVTASNGDVVAWLRPTSSFAGESGPLAVLCAMVVAASTGSSGTAPSSFKFATPLYAYAS